MRNSSVHIHFVHATLAHAREGNIDIPSLLSRSRIALQLIGMDDIRVSARQYANLQTLTMSAMNDEFVGHTPYPVPMGAWTAMCHWLVNTRTLGQLLTRLCRFYDILGKGFRPRLEMRGNAAILCVDPISHAQDYGLYGYELFLFACYRLLCWMTRERIPIHRLHMPFPKPRHHGEYAHLFYSYPVYFDQDSCSISFNRSILDLQVRQSLETLNLLMRDPLYEIITQEYDYTSWSARVMHTIHRQPTARNSLGDIANALETNSHTLRRRLAEEGQSFIDLKREVKRDLAIHYLSGSSLTIEEVASAIGFSEASAFIRAFKQWTGITPFTYRKDS